MKSLNARAIDEATQHALWFPAIKAHSLWARISEHRQWIDSREGRVVAKKGDFICKGVEGEFWPQKAALFLRKYEPVGEEASGSGWREYRPKPEAGEVLAARLDHPFAVSTPHGQLKGRAGDYLVQSLADPDDVWIVAAAIFTATYDRKA